MEKDFLSSVPEGGFPEGKIVLVDGTELTCHPKASTPGEIEGNDLKLDTTGTYLRLKNRPALTPKELDAARKAHMELFVQNAFLFYKNAARIMNDSRMFLAPVDMGNNLAYTGVCGLRNATLGVYLEWWLYSPVDITHDVEGEPALTVSFAGSPLSGMNSCSAVRPDGEWFNFSSRSFSLLWSSFWKINCRYTEAKQMYDAYSLEEVRQKLVCFSVKTCLDTTREND